MTKKFLFHYPPHSLFLFILFTFLYNPQSLAKDDLKFDTLSRGNGDEYAGQLKAGRPHGQGTMIWASGSKYVGGYKDGKRHGQGIFTHADGAQYIGGNKDGKQHGQGTMIWASGSQYTGEYKTGKRHGQGTYTHADGAQYIGEWKAGAEHGQGTLTYPSGAHYTGQFKDGEYHGEGTYTWADGVQYTGEYKTGKRHGQGTLTYTSGSQYTGEYKADERHGQGVYIDADGDKYVGEYKYGKSNGQGISTYADGKYAGQYAGAHKDNKRHGQGAYAWDEGGGYIGEWKAGEIHGRGMYTFKNGDQYVGTWQDGTPYGEGLYIVAKRGQNDQDTLTHDDGDNYVHSTFAEAKKLQKLINAGHTLSSAKKIIAKPDTKDGQDVKDENRKTEQQESKNVDWKLGTYKNMVVLSRNGGVTYGDTMIFTFFKNNCNRVQHMFFMYTHEDRDFKYLEGEKLMLAFNGYIGDLKSETPREAEILMAERFLMGNRFMLDFGTFDKDSLLTGLQQVETIEIVMEDGNGHTVGDFFDIPHNNWSMNGVQQAFFDAYNMCMAQEL